MRAGLSWSNSRRMKVSSLAWIAVLAVFAMAASTASGAAGKACCYRVTIYERGHLFISYSTAAVNPEPSDPTGQYRLDWGGAAYTVSRYTDGVLSPIKAVTYGHLDELDMVAPANGTENIYNCRPAAASYKSRRGVFHQGGDPVVQVRSHGLSFGAPYYQWHQKCGLPSSNISNLLSGTPGWHEELFDTAYLRGFTKQIFHSQRVLCTGHAAASDPAQGTQASGYIARYINVVHFAPADLKRQERRLHGYIGKAPPAHDPASRQFDKHYFNPVDFPPPPNGCQAQ